MELINLEKVSDPITRDRILLMHPKVRQDIIDGIIEVEAGHVRIRMVQGNRTFEYQQTLYDQGRSAPGPIVTWARPGFSFHQYALAWDFCLLHGVKTISWNRNEDLDLDHEPDWMETVGVFINRGWEWGGNFPAGKKDYPHLQKSFGHTIAELYSLHEQKRYDAQGFILI